MINYDLWWCDKKFNLDCTKYIEANAKSVYSEKMLALKELPY